MFVIEVYVGKASALFYYMYYFDCFISVYTPLLEHHHEKEQFQ